MAREQRVDVLRLRWYVDSRREPADVPERWLALCREHLPAALPRRFGATEPLRGRLDRDGDTAFARAYSDAEVLLFMAGEPPCLGGSLGTPRRSVRIGPMTSHQLDIRLDAAADPGVRALFEAAAGAFGTVFASASVERDLRAARGRAARPDRPGRRRGCGRLAEREPSRRAARRLPRGLGGSRWWAMWRR